MLTLNIFLFLLTFVAMEFVAWFTHKYVMHGLLWILHRDHHTRDNEGFFERNDTFFFFFAVPSFFLFYFGHENGLMDPRIWIGAGIAVYGLTYIIVHDIFIHQRFKWLRRTQNPYFLALRKAHKMHHKHLGKEDGECFGMLWAPLKYLAQAKETLQKS